MAPTLWVSSRMAKACSLIHADQRPGHWQLWASTVTPWSVQSLRGIGSPFPEGRVESRWRMSSQAGRLEFTISQPVHWSETRECGAWGCGSSPRVVASYMENILRGFWITKGSPIFLLVHFFMMALSSSIFFSHGIFRSVGLISSSVIFNLMKPSLALLDSGLIPEKVFCRAHPSVQGLESWGTAQLIVFHQNENEAQSCPYLFRSWRQNLGVKHDWSTLMSGEISSQL